MNEIFLKHHHLQHDHHLDLHSSHLITLLFLLLSKFFFQMKIREREKDRRQFGTEEIDGGGGGSWAEQAWMLKKQRWGSRRSTTAEEAWCVASSVTGGSSNRSSRHLGRSIQSQWRYPRWADEAGGGADGWTGVYIYS